MEIKLFSIKIFQCSSFNTEKCPNCSSKPVFSLCFCCYRCRFSCYCYYYFCSFYFCCSCYFCKSHLLLSSQKIFTCLKSTIETLKKGVKYFQINWRRSCVFIVNFKYISHLFVVFLWLTLNK